MSHPLPDHPSRQVERIREILTGRQMNAVERRLDKLERVLSPMPVERAVGVFETQLADLRRQTREEWVQLRDQIDSERLRQLEETRRLSQQIQAVARSRSEAEAIADLEQRLGHWLETWQAGLLQQFKQREDHLIQELRAELERMRAWTREEIQRHPGPDLSRLRGSFEQLAGVTRAIADSIQPGASRTP